MAGRAVFVIVLFVGLELRLVQSVSIQSRVRRLVLDKQILLQPRCSVRLAPAISIPGCTFRIETIVLTLRSVDVSIHCHSYCDRIRAWWTPQSPADELLVRPNSPDELVMRVDVKVG